MKFEKLNFKIKYEDYIVEAELQEDNYIEFYLQKEYYGIKTFMFGIPFTNITEVLDILKANLDEHIEYYEKEYVEADK